MPERAADAERQRMRRFRRAKSDTALGLFGLSLSARVAIQARSARSSRTRRVTAEDQIAEEGTFSPAGETEDSNRIRW